MENQNASENSISFLDILKMMRKHLIGIIVCMTVCIALSIVYIAFLERPTYVAKSQVMVNNYISDEKVGSLSYGINIVTTYKDFVVSDHIAEKITDVVEPEFPYSVSAESQENSLVITVIVSSKSKEEAEELAAAYRDVTLQIINDNQNSRYDVLKEATIVSLDSEVVASKNSKRSLFMLLGIVMGIVASVIYICIHRLIQNTYPTAKSIEEDLQIPVLSSVPEYNKNKD